MTGVYWGLGSLLVGGLAAMSLLAALLRSLISCLEGDLDAWFQDNRDAEGRMVRVGGDGGG